jgi:hypothetical protein
MNSPTIQQTSAAMAMPLDLDWSPGPGAAWVLVSDIDASLPEGGLTVSDPARPGPKHGELL